MSWNLLCDGFASEGCFLRTSGVRHRDIPDLLSLRSKRLEVVGERENGRARGRHFFQSPKIFSSGLAVACTYVARGFVVVVCLFFFMVGGVMYRCQTRKRWGRWRGQAMETTWSFLTKTRPELDDHNALHSFLSFWWIVKEAAGYFHHAGLLSAARKCS